MSFNDDLVHFVLGSSLFFTVYPQVYLYHAYSQLTPAEKDQSKISGSVLCALLPPTFGFVFALTYRMLGFVPRKSGDSFYMRYVIAGAVAATFISLLLHFVFDVHVSWLHAEDPNAYHFATFVFYLVLFFSVGQWVRSQILYGPTPVKASPLPSVSTPSPSGGGGSASVFDRLATKSS